VGKPEEKRSLESRRSIWEDNIKIDVKGIGWGAMDWFPLSE
jgi:hypothetical protein